MIRGIYRNGVIYPTDPVPPEWADGQEVQVDLNGKAAEERSEVERWDAEMRALGPIRFGPGERERFQRALDEADALAKDQVRRRMELEN